MKTKQIKTSKLCIATRASPGPEKEGIVGYSGKRLGYLYSIGCMEYHFRERNFTTNQNIISSCLVTLTNYATIVS